jgi:hypothetical protein
VGLLVFAKRMGVNLSAIGIGVDFLQVVSLFSSFGFRWPIQLRSLFNASSVSSFNEQLFAPECSVGTWSFKSKYVAVLVHHAAAAPVSVKPLHNPLWLSCRCRWYLTQSIPLFLIGGLVGFVVADAVRVSLGVQGYFLSRVPLPKRVHHVSLVGFTVHWGRRGSEGGQPRIQVPFVPAQALLPVAAQPRP